MGYNSPFDNPPFRKDWEEERALAERLHKASREEEKKRNYKPLPTPNGIYIDESFLGGISFKIIKERLENITGQKIDLLTNFNVQNDKKGNQISAKEVNFVLPIIPPPKSPPQNYSAKRVITQGAKGEQKPFGKELSNIFNSC